jgi:hypothetical protein
MGRELGRISGPLLSENLLRNGSDLVFDNDLLYLNVTTRRIGIRSSAPTHALLIPNTTDTRGLIVDRLTEVANFTISGHQIQDIINTPIIIRPNQSSPTITTPGLATSLLTFYDSTLVNNTADSNINFTPSGTGVSNIRNDVLVNGGVHATGNITWDGDITLGNDDADNIEFSADVNSNIIPNLNDTYDLGSPDKQWLAINTKNYESSLIETDVVNATTLTIGDIKFEANRISNVNSSNDIVLTSNGDGLVMFNGVNYINVNEIPVPDVFTLQGTSNGYVKFDGTTGLVIPYGPTVGPEGVELGMFRFNTDLGYTRVFNGTNWQPVGGVSAVLNEEEVNDIMWIWDFTLG